MDMIDELINDIKNKGYTQSRIEKYIRDCGGIDKLKKKDLDRYMHEIDFAYSDPFISGIYNQVKNNKSGENTMIVSIIAIIIAIASLAVAILSLFSQTSH